MIAGLVPNGLVEHCERDIRQEKFVLSRSADDLVEVTPEHWMFLPILFGDFDLQIDKKHAIDGYQLRFTGSYRGHGSAYEFAHGEDVVVVLTWCPPAERRSKRVRQ